MNFENSVEVSKVENSYQITIRTDDETLLNEVLNGLDTDKFDLKVQKDIAGQIIRNLLETAKK